MSSPTRHCPPRCCSRCSSGTNESSFNSITVDGDTSTSDTVLLCATQQAQTRRDRQPRRSAPRRFPPRARQRDDRPRPADRARRRGRAEIRDDRGDRRRKRRGRRAGSAWRSATRRWSRRRSPPATPIGAASSWRSANAGRRPTATGCRFRSAASRSPPRAGRCRATTRRRSQQHMAGREITIGVDIGIGTRQGHGVDLRPDPRLHRHQWQLPQLMARPSAGYDRSAQAAADRPRRGGGAGRRRRAGAAGASGRRASTSPACGNFPAARCSRARRPRRR